MAGTLLFGELHRHRIDDLDVVERYFISEALAARALVGGLDKQYRLHKYLGISTVLSALFHWGAFLSDDFAMDFGYVELKNETFPLWKLLDGLGDQAQLIG
ncbi:hypothetical protein [Vibrio alginolyticus]|uniref:hypothetical protein n=1 Tax=Vibrio alginolyticus TaxID=663 RepID=UPI000B2DBD86|nr:hypothetical protein [Vibrio alginolyticus]